LDVGEFAARAFTGDEAKRFVPTLVKKGITNICLNTAIKQPACCSDPDEPCSFSILPLPIDRDANFDPVIFIDGIEVAEAADERGEAFAAGTAITNRTLSFGSQPFFPSGIDGSDPGPFRRIFLEDSATPCTNGREPANGRQNGIVFFPGSAPLYRNGVMIGG